MYKKNDVAAKNTEKGIGSGRGMWIRDSEFAEETSPGRNGFGWRNGGSLLVIRTIDLISATHS